MLPLLVVTSTFSGATTSPGWRLERKLVLMKFGSVCACVCGCVHTHIQQGQASYFPVVELRGLGRDGSMSGFHGDRDGEETPVSPSGYLGHSQTCVWGIRLSGSMAPPSLIPCL